MKKYFVKKILLLCFALLQINLNAAVITKIINNSNKEVSFEFYENNNYIDEQHLTLLPLSGISRLNINFPLNQEPFASLIHHEKQSPKKGETIIAFLDVNVPNYLKIITRLGIFYVAQGKLIHGDCAVFGIWKQQVFKTATRNMGNFSEKLIIVIDRIGEIQISEDRLDFVLAYSAHALC